MEQPDKKRLYILTGSYYYRNRKRNKDRPHIIKQKNEKNKVTIEKNVILNFD